MQSLSNASALVSDVQNELNELNKQSDRLERSEQFDERFEQRAQLEQRAHDNSSELDSDYAELSSPQRLIDQYQEQLAMQNATKNYVCAPAQSLEALYVEQFRKMAKREDVLKEVPVADGNRFDVSSQLRLPEEETQTLEELVKAFRSKKLQRVAALRKNQTVCEESLRLQMRYAATWLKVYISNKLRDTFAEFQFALKQLTLYSH